MTIELKKFFRHARNRAGTGISHAAKLATATAIFFSAVEIPAHATGIPVVDAAAIANQMVAISHAVSQVKALNDQLKNMKDHLKAISGSRGMGKLETVGVTRDYLGQTLGNIAKSSQEMATNVEAIIGSNAVLTNEELKKLSPEERDRILRYRQQVAIQKAAADMTYSKASKNIERLQRLMNAIDSASDVKAIADLQARIQAEELMLHNDTIKLQQAQQGMEADRRALDLQREEVRKKLLGSSSTKFPDIKIQ